MTLSTFRLFAFGFITLLSRQLSAAELTTGPVLTAPEPDHSLEFIANQGQWAPEVRFEAPLPAGRLFLRNTGFTYGLYDPATVPGHHEKTKNGSLSNTKAHAYTVEFEGALGSGRVQGEEALG
ncbi:hypothetical protein LJY25_20910, partial [Hymenobacter sp. BT175]|uniref:DUF7948 domain-containing protein n=1 Tax=Hymenobacter translucens TaxID=2886507 RepID=UPI001D0EC0A7